jgi:hypothetical protein
MAHHPCFFKPFSELLKSVHHFFSSLGAHTMTSSKSLVYTALEWDLLLGQIWRAFCPAQETHVVSDLNS